MAIKINTTIHKTVPVINDDGLILAVLMNARQTDAGGAVVTRPEVLRINSLEDLTRNFAQSFVEGSEVNTGLEALKELYTLEYLLRGGANLLVLATEVVGEFSVTDAAKLRVEDVTYKVALAPYHFIDSFGRLDGLDLIVSEGSEVESVDATLLLDVLPTIPVGQIGNISIGQPRISLNINSAIVPFTSVYKWGELDYIDFHVSSDGYMAATDFVGIPASVFVALREAINLNKGEAWVPVAGETTGIFPEATKVFRKFTTPEKNAFQAGHINPMVLKRGIGILMVAQNTSYKPADTKNPLRRKHIVSLVLAIKRRVRAISERFLFASNTPNTWDAYKLELDDYLGKLYRAGGLTEFQTVVDNTIITRDDINNGIMRAYIEITPVGVVEGMEINIAIREHADSVDVMIEGLEGGI